MQASSRFACQRLSDGEAALSDPGNCSRYAATT